MITVIFASLAIINIIMLVAQPSLDRASTACFAVAAAILAAMLGWGEQR